MSISSKSQVPGGPLPSARPVSGGETVALPAGMLLQLAAAPHRLLFFVGASNVLLAMAWWTAWLFAARWNALPLAQPAVPAGWMHAVLMQYHVLPSFMFGFLLTVFPRWMALPPLSRRHYVPVGLGLFGGQVLTLLGLMIDPRLVHAGAMLTIAGWTLGEIFLVRLVWADRGRTWHAVSCAFALSFGLLGLILYAVYLHRADARLMFAAIKLGGFAFLLPIFFTVCHRMIPFFANAVIPGYRVVRPMWSLASVWALTMGHAWLELRHGYTWLWTMDVPLSVLFGWLLWQWWPRTEQVPPLLKVLFLGFAWLPATFALFSAQSLWFAATGEFALGRAPAHALFVGFFGSLLVAMVTRVTQGHSGRPLVLGKVAATTFVLVQIVAVLRIAAEILPDALAWQAIAGLGWLIAFLPWVLRSTWIYWTPRIDGKAG